MTEGQFDPAYLAGKIEEGFRASRERYDAMRADISEMRRASEEGHKLIGERVDAVTALIRQESTTIMDVIETQHKAAVESVAELKKDHGKRLDVLELDKAKVQGGWRAIVITCSTAVGASGAAIGALKLLGFLK